MASDYARDLALCMVRTCGMRRFTRDRTELRAHLTAPPWTLAVRRWPALARTRITLAGELDDAAVAALALAVEQARKRGDAVSLDLGDLTACPPNLAASYRAARETAPPGLESSGFS